MAEEGAARRASRRTGYVLSALFNALLLYLINSNPGWQSWSFLTPEFTEVLRPVNAALGFGLGLSLIVLIFDTTFWRGLRQGINSTLGLVVLARLFVVFPFAVEEDSIWRLVLRAVLILGMIGAFIGVVTGLGRVARAMHVRANYKR